MWVMSETSSLAIVLEASLSTLSLPLETRTLNSTPLVQNTIDEFRPPLLSNRIWERDNSVMVKYIAYNKNKNREREREGKK